jgi:hypothetical protein
MMRSNRVRPGASRLNPAHSIADGMVPVKFTVSGVVGQFDVEGNFTPPLSEAKSPLQHQIDPLPFRGAVAIRT